MPSATFICNGCDEPVDVYWSNGHPLPDPHERECETCRNVTEFSRQWTPVSIGQVPGAGGSPARQGWVAK